MSGIHKDDGKPRMDLLPVNPIRGAAQVMTWGALKYADRNWERGIDYSRIYGSLLRHVTAWWGGEDIDPESGLPHLHHAICNLMFLAEYESRPEKFFPFDNRPYKGGDE